MSNSKTNRKMIKMEIRKIFPKEMTIKQCLDILEELSDEYRNRSRKEIQNALKTKLKDIDYTPILRKDG